MSIVNLPPDTYRNKLASWQDVTEAQPTVMAPQTVHLGLGSNLGDRRAMLQRALDALHALPETEVLHCSQIYETEPWGDIAQDPFYNCAVEIRTVLQPFQLLAAVKDIERDMGRIEVQRNGPRIIDIDILLYGNIVLKQKGLTIPHPSMTERNFVLHPLREIAGGIVHPVEQVTIIELARRCADAGGAVETGIVLTPSPRRTDVPPSQR